MNVSPVIPQWQQVSFNQIQDSFDPQPEGERFLIGALLLDEAETVCFSTDTSYKNKLHHSLLFAHLAELGPRDQTLWVPLGFGSYTKTFRFHITQC